MAWGGAVNDSYIEERIKKMKRLQATVLMGLMAIVLSSGMSVPALADNGTQPKPVCQTGTINCRQIVPPSRIPPPTVHLPPSKIPTPGSGLTTVVLSLINTLLGLAH